MLAAGTVSFAKLNWKDIMYSEGRGVGFERRFWKCCVMLVREEVQKF